MTPFLTLTNREIMRFVKVIGQTVLTPIVNSTLYLLIFGVSLGASVSLKNGLSYLAFIIPGLVTMSALNNAYQNSASSIISSKFNGDLMDLRTVPLSPQAIVWAMSIGGMVRALVVGLCTLIVSEVFHFVTKGTLLGLTNPLLFLFFVTLGSIAFSMLGIVVGFRARSFEQVNAISAFVLLPLLYLGGVFFSLENLHPFWRAVSQGNPLLYLINGVRYSSVGVSDVEISHSLTITCASFAILYVIASRAVKFGSYQRW